MTDSLPERFERARARFFDGLEAFNAQRWADAEAHYRASLEALPGRASTLINLAATQLELGRPEAALATADQALAAEPDGLEGWLHRGTALIRLNRFGDALPAFERLLEIDPGYLFGWLQRALVLERLSRPSEALVAFDKALEVDPASLDAWSGRGGLLRELGRPDEAAHAYREAIRHGADPALHAYYLASVDAGPAPAAAPAGYVAALFDDYADEFDAHLVGHLGYRAPAQLVGGIALPPGGRFRHALDLGCGTGLCGPLLRPLAERLTGVDLAPRMVEKARARGLYDRLEADEIVRFLDGDPATRYDLIVAADVFIYFGDLGPVFAAVRRQLDPGGRFCFTVETSFAAGDYTLLPSLRYAHAEAYLRRLADAARFEFVALKRLPVREDQRVAIAGSFVYLQAGG